MSDPTKRALVVTRVFAEPLEEVWKAWSEPDFVRKWWGPAGFTCPVAKMDFREGGRSLVCMRAPAEFGGQDLYNTWSYQRILERERIEFVLRFSDRDGQPLAPAAMGMPPGVPAEVPHCITFRALGDRRTEITVTESGYTANEAVETSRRGLEQCLDKMEAIFAGGTGR